MKKGKLEIKEIRVVKVRMNFDVHKENGRRGGQGLGRQNNRLGYE
jgi:hypothetical protein